MVMFTITMYSYLTIVFNSSYTVTITVLVHFMLHLSVVSLGAHCAGEFILTTRNEMIAVCFNCIEKISTIKSGTP